MYKSTLYQVSSIQLHNCCHDNIGDIKKEPDEPDDFGADPQEFCETNITEYEGEHFLTPAFPKKKKKSTSKKKSALKHCMRHKCPDCSLTFELEEHMKIHYTNVHVENKNDIAFVVDRENQVSIPVYADTKLKHIRSYPCNLCNFSTNKLTKLKDHMKLDFECEDCGERYHGETAKKEYKEHNRTLHPGKDTEYRGWL